MAPSIEQLDAQWDTVKQGWLNQYRIVEQEEQEIEQLTKRLEASKEKLQIHERYLVEICGVDIEELRNEAERRSLGE